MRATTISQTGTGRPTAVVIVDRYTSPTAIAVGCIASGTVTYTVQHTYDDPFATGFTAAGATWFDHSTIASKANVNADGNYAFPPRAISVSVASGTGTVTVTVNQAGTGQ
jgi:hypothetical protein